MSVPNSAALRGFRNANDEDALEAAQRFWQDVVEGLEDRLGQRGEWIEWRHHRFANGELYEEIAQRWHPVFSRRHSSGRAFSINQSPSDWRGDRAFAYVEVDDERDAGWPREELLFDVVISREIACAVANAIAMWMDPEKTREDVLRHIACDTPIETLDYPIGRVAALRKSWWWRRVTAPARRKNSLSAPSPPGIG